MGKRIRRIDGAAKKSATHTEKHQHNQSYCIFIVKVDIDDVWPHHRPTSGIWKESTQPAKEDKQKEMKQDNSVWFAHWYF